MKVFSHAERFSGADGAHAGELIAYLEQTSSTERVSADKRRSYGALELRPGMSVLDVGCGLGDDVRMLREVVGSGGRVVGVDLSEAMVEQARRRSQDEALEYYVCSAEALPFDEGSFDAVRADRVFQHLAQPDMAAKEMYRVLKPGGRAMVLDQDWETITIAGSDKRLTRLMVAAYTDNLANGWAGRDAVPLLRRTGFTHVKVAPNGYFPAYAWARKFVLEMAADKAIATGLVTREEAERWLGDLHVASERNEFVCFFTYFATVGVK